MVVDTYDTRTGGIVSTKRFTEQLRANGHKVTIISASCKDPERVLMKKFYPPFGKKIMKKMKMVFAWPDEEKIKAAIEGVDLVHIQLPFYLGTKTISLARKLHLPVVTSFHVQAENITHNIGITSQNVNDQIYRFFVSSFYNKSDLVICPSKFAMQELKHYHLGAEHKIISNGYTETFYPQRVNRKFPNKFVVLTVGRLSAEKKQQELIQAINHSKYSPNIQLVIVGEGPLKSELKKEGKVLHCNPLFLSKLTPEKLAFWYNQADLYVHCGRVELEGMTVLEALACGTPPLIANAPKSASKQFALDHRSLYNSPMDLTRKIDYWYEHPLELLKSKERYSHLAKRYPIKKSLKELEKAYERAIIINSKNHKNKYKENEGPAWKQFLFRLGAKYEFSLRRR